MKTKQLIKSMWEIIPVTFGVLVALICNNWNENRKDTQFIDNILTLVEKELVEGNKELEETLLRQITFGDTLNYYFNDDNLSILNIAIKVNGLGVTNFKINSWEALSNSKVELLSFDNLIILSEIESSREYLLAKNEAVLKFLYENMNESSKNKKQVLLIMVQDLIGTEEEIKENIQKYFELPTK